MKQKLILLTLVIGLTIVSQSTLSLGMGNIQVYSALDEQLRSTIELMTNPDEDLQNLTVKLASNADYKKVGLDRSFVPINILVNLDEDNPNIVNVTSNGPVSEPIISLLLDVNWNNGRILREFTILLDPPVYDVPTTNVQVNNVVVEQIQAIDEASPQAEVVTEATDVEPATQTTFTNEDVAQYERPDPVVEPVAEPIAETTVAYQQTNDDVYVNAGDTLWSIANRNKLGGLSTNQMMMAIYNNNSGSFIDNNINKLIKGSQLKMPSLDQAEAISYAEALAQVESHHQSWAPEQQNYSSYQTTEETYSDNTDTSSGLDYGVQLSGGDSEGSDSGLTNAEVGDSEVDQLSAEEQYNQESESADLQERISELEEIVEQQQSVIEVSDDGLANLETQLADASETASDETAEMLDDVWDETTDSVEEATDSISDFSVDLGSIDTSGETDDTLSDESLVADDNSIPVDEMVEDGMAEDSSDESASPNETDATETEEKTAVAPPKFSATIKEEPSVVDKTINWVMDNLKWVLIGLGALVLLLIVPRFLRSDGEEADETSFLDDIKQRKAEADQDDVESYESVDTKVNQPLEDTDEFVDSDDEEDVLAELDKSITFDEGEDADIEDKLFETDELTSTDGDDFDLDGFLNEGDNDTSITADHSETMAAAGFTDDLEDDIEKTEEVELASDDAFEEVSFDDLGMDLDDVVEAVDEAEKSAEESIEDAVDDIENTFDLDDELADLDLDDEDADEDKAASDEVSSDEEEFSFDEDFDFDLDDESEDDETESAVADEIEDKEDSSDEFDDLLDLSDETDSFDTATGDEMDEEIDLGLEGLMDDADAIDTKLDLAKAYLEMGDVEGAKNLLDEVVAEGSDAQIDEAKKIIDDM
ncbi:FimV/HubP family polar landmark protein [Marinicella litoralis]|uniref:FimV-like protein n=1 Tax=Marinicella litoralis TaxID=644220 RepID=A0A4R6XRW8_9GAMM|nr:FimV/HubP family polar landmark protein [Marinicella litoralis]TDR22496.1 FimV-like protein [Marinicella litoralis]